MPKQDFAQAVATVTEALRTEGFESLTEIDMQATTKAKPGIEGRPHRILGARHPPLAHRALSALPDISLLSPCNAVIRQQEDGPARPVAVSLDGVDWRAGVLRLGQPECETPPDVLRWHLASGEIAPEQHEQHQQRKQRKQQKAMLDRDAKTPSQPSAHMAVTLTTPKTRRRTRKKKLGSSWLRK